ncbi:MAG: hypothetical protein IJS54_00790 [Desulfovibrio sp.]|nr:hypothetical protein [Desulfovibrio sp.]
MMPAKDKIDVINAPYFVEVLFVDSGEADHQPHEPKKELPFLPSQRQNASVVLLGWMVESKGVQKKSADSRKELETAEKAEWAFTNDGQTVNATR